VAARKQKTRTSENAKRASENEMPMTAKTKEIVDPRLATALGHPLRVHILGAVAQRPLSPVQVARERSEPVSKVSYHFNVLRDCKCIELAEEVPKRGAVEHVYRGTERALLEDTDWKQLPKSVRGGATGVTLLDLFKNALGAVEAGSFDARDDRHLSWSTLILDEQGWGQLTSALERTRKEVEDLAAEVVERLAKTGEKGFGASFALAAYETPPPDAERE
jgi:DNA-binding transcriptional ArsR family regulator